MEYYEQKITLDEIKKAAEWAKEAASEAKPIGGIDRTYNQSEWDCGTSCCMWGAASIATGAGPASRGPSSEWAAQSQLHVCAAGLLNSGISTPDQMIQLLSGADLNGADLGGAYLSGANLRGADLSCANLRGADLSCADLIGADLSGADLSDADLSFADLSGAYLSGANLRGADLSCADLIGADLSCADLIGADLIGADLIGADLSGATVSIGNVTVRIE